MKLQPLIISVLVFCACWSSTGAFAGGIPRVGDLSKVDLEFMSQQRQSLQDMTALSLGRQFNGNRDQDLELLQALLDRKLVRADQTLELQAMGVIIGDLLAKELDMHWVIYEDREGRSRALRYKATDEFLFPITMIARRQEVGNQTPVVDIYQKAHDIIFAKIPPLPFQ
ncbi:MAG: DUF3806 domain-containing protein [Halioglobus sp.]|nr:DUF3806 domain-containing protein [Halioglobus sp.]